MPAASQFIALPLTLLVACTGAVGSSQQDTADDDRANGGAGGNRQTMSGRAGSDATVDSLGAQPMRRLSRSEYDRTLADLLEAPSAFGKRLVPDQQIEGLTNDARTLVTSPAMARQHFESMSEVAKAAAARRSQLAPCQSSSPSADTCAKEFVRDFGKRAWRRPLTQDEATSLYEIFKLGAQTNEQYGYALVIETLLISPAFIFRVEEGPTSDGRPGPYDMAARLSYALWGTMPDRELLKLADEDALKTDAQINQQVDRMLADRRAKDGAMAFFSDWLDFDLIGAARKDPLLFPGYDNDTGAQLTAEAEAFVSDATFGPQASIDALVTAPWTYTNQALSKYYGQTPSTSAAIVRGPDDRERRSGLLTLGGLLSVLAKPDQTSPSLRGKFVRERLLCMPLPPPPPNVNNSVSPPSASSTTRERFVEHDKAECASCHRLMDPIGFGLERYDARGVYRETEAGKSIDESGEVVDIKGIGKFSGAVELGAKLRDSEAFHSCLAQTMFRFVTGRGVTPDDDAVLETLTSDLHDDRQLIKLLRGVTSTAAFRKRAKVQL